MLHPKKAPSKKQKHGSIDFKKIKRKIGRKLPPPKNSTNTQIKSKAIILPEQSVLSERAGLAVSSKGLTLRELLQQTSHHNAKTRKFALLGIKDLLQKNPSELKLHKLVIIEKLRERICDNDNVVRDTLYRLMKTTIFPASKEDASMVSLMMAYVFNAMTHLALDIRLTAFNFFDLIVMCYPSSFFMYAEKVIDNYKDILQNSQIYMQDRSKVKTAIGGLARCLCLLCPDKGKAGPSYEQEVAQRTLHAFESETSKEHNSICSIIGEVEELMPILVHCFQEFAPVNHAVPVIDATSFDCMLSTLQCTKLAVCFLVSEIDRSQTYLQGPVSSKSSKPDAMKNTVCILERLWQSFPISSMHESTEKEDERYFILNTKITEICLHIVNGSKETKILMEKFLEFIENSLYGQICSDSQTNNILQDKHFTSVLPLIPGVLLYLNGDWRIRLLKAFTSTFQDCKVESKLNLACLSVIEKLLLSVPESMLSVDSFGQDALYYQAVWLQKLLWSLLQAEDKNYSLSKVILRLVLKIGQCSFQNPSFEFEYNNLQFLLREFYCTTSDEGYINYGPFLKLPKDCQELAICCLYYFSNLDSHLLQSLAYCSLCDVIEQAMLMRIIDVLQSSYKAGHMQIADYISFLVTVVARFKVFHDKTRFEKEDHEKISNRRVFKSITEAVFSCLSELGDSVLVLKLLQKSVLEEMHLKPSLDNMHGMLRMITVLDSRLSKLTGKDIITLSHFIFVYMIDITSKIPDIFDADINLHSIRMSEYYIKPCIFLFSGCGKLMNSVLQLFASMIESNLSLVSQSDNNLDLPTQVNAVAIILVIMFKNVKVFQNISSKEAIKDILKHIFNLLSSNTINLTVEERHKISSTFNRVKAEAYKEKCLEATDLEGIQLQN